MGFQPPQPQRQPFKDIKRGERCETEPNDEVTGDEEITEFDKIRMNTSSEDEEAEQEEEEKSGNACLINEEQIQKSIVGRL